MPKQLRNFNPRSPHGERHFANIERKIDNVFQSTLPARGATQRKRASGAGFDISIHAPRTGSDKDVQLVFRRRAYISIHAPRTGSDLSGISNVRGFSSISIHAPRTGSDVTIQRTRLRNYAISIHAPRTGSDYIADRILSNMRHFNPRSPHGERLLADG